MCLSFSVTGIGPAVDAAFTDAFPLFIEFNNSLDNSFTQTAIPEPLTILGAGTAAGFGAFFKHQLNRKKKDKIK